MTKKQKLELTWIGKENRPKLEPRILPEDPEKSYHAPHRITNHDLFDNRLIFGDNQRRRPNRDSKSWIPTLSRGIEADEVSLFEACA
ncbi:MAG: hypothetical protein WD425_05625 [Nitrospirales bacterium]